jgi:ATP-dependent Clp endopeptidase proteolytic subunit ClpP
VAQTQAARLKELEVQLKEVEVEKARQELRKLEFETNEMYDRERDRLVKTGRIRHLYINAMISGNTADAWLEALQHWERRDPGEPVTVDLNTPGGSIVDGLAIFDQLRRMTRKGHRITTRAVGGCFSMGAVILQAGDERIADARSRILIHEGSVTYGQGTSLSRGEEEDYRKFREALLADILDIMAERSTLSKRQIKQRWSRKDWYLTAEEALKYGFVDRVE